MHPHSPNPTAADERLPHQGEPASCDACEGSGLCPECCDERCASVRRRCVACAGCAVCPACQGASDAPARAATH